jgi:hypothetical protein
VKYRHSLVTFIEQISPSKQSSGGVERGASFVINHLIGKTSSSPIKQLQDPPEDEELHGQVPVLEVRGSWALGPGRRGGFEEEPA